MRDCSVAQPNEETAKLILEILEGKSDQDQIKQLDALLISSRESRAYYTGIISIHAMLRSLYNKKTLT